MDPDRVELAGSARRPPEDAVPQSVVLETETATATVLLRRKASAVPEPTPVHVLTRDSFESTLGAREEDIAAIQNFAEQYALRITGIDRAGRTVTLEGSVGSLSKAFGTTLTNYHGRAEIFRGRDGALSVPRALSGIVLGVFGLDDRPQADFTLDLTSHGDVAEGGGLTGSRYADLYSFPEGFDGRGQTIGIVALGGGYRLDDLSRYFQAIGLDTPGVDCVECGAKNDFGRNFGADGELALDIEVSGAAAPGARIVVYFAPNTDQGFIGGFKAAVHDNVQRPSVLVTTWGSPEDRWTEQLLEAMNDTFVDAALLGVSVVVAAGDHGAADRLPLKSQSSGQVVPNPAYDGQRHVDFPGSSPYALACGGTSVHFGDSGTLHETVWNSGGGWATGGGISRRFGRPPWQRFVSMPESPTGRHMRGMPDLAMNADRSPGYRVYFAGQNLVAGGTSAVAPLCAGFVARCNQALGTPLGLVSPLLYGVASDAGFNDITQGSNGIEALRAQPATAGYDAAIGWDCCTGLGSPRGGTILIAILVNLLRCGPRRQRNHGSGTQAVTPKKSGLDIRALANTLHERGLVDLDKTLRETVHAAAEGVEAAGLEDFNWYAAVGSAYGVVIK
jgi:kumamolisin